MKYSFEWLSKLSFRSLKLRLIVYLLVAGSVPLICALIVFYMQSADYTKKEFERFASRTHNVIANQMQLDFQKMERQAVSINQSRTAQQLMMLDAFSFSAEKSELVAELNEWIKEALGSDLPVSDICLTFSSANVSVCGDMTLLQTSAPVERHHSRLEFFTGRDNLQYLRYLAPLYDIQTNEVKGYLIFVMDQQLLLKPPQDDFPIIEHVLINSSSGAVIRYALPNRGHSGWDDTLAVRSVQTTAAGVISTQPFRALNQQWISRMRWENQGHAELRKSLARSAMLILLLLAVLSITASILFARGVTRPLQVLRSLMKRAELGDLKAYWTLNPNQDIYELGESYNQMLNRLEDLIKQVKIEESLKKEKEFEALQYQLNPHFLYNTLNTIKWVAKIHQTPQISEAVSALVRLLQASLGKKGDFLPLRDEIRLVHDYMAIQTFRYGDEIQLHTEIDPVASLCLVPKLILQPLVENAIIHGLDQKSGKDKQITIKAWLDRDLLICQVEDNGKGMDVELIMQESGGNRDGAKEKMSGIGLRHIREKIKLYYGPDYKMLIFSKPNQGTTIRLSLPIHRGEE